MANLTITVDDGLLKRARIRAVEQGTSVNAVLARQLELFADRGSEQRSATEALFALAETNVKNTGGSHRKRRRWTRDELHERR